MSAPILWTFYHYWYNKADQRWYECHHGYESIYPNTFYKSILVSEGAD